MRKKAVLYLAVVMTILFCFNIKGEIRANAAESDFIIENGWLIEYTGPGGAVVVPDGVTVIDGNAFKDNPNVGEITSITLPDSVVELYDGAFRYCTGMKNIRLSKNLKKIGHWAFLNCSSLTNLTIPESVTHISESVFDGCVNLELLTLPPQFNPKNGTNVHWGINYRYFTKLATDGTKLVKVYLVDPGEDSMVANGFRENDLPLCKLELQADKITLAPKATYELRMNSHAKCDSWTSSDPAVASVNHYGKITAKKPGTAVITATLYGTSFHCEVTVKNGVVSDQPSVTVLPDFVIEEGVLCEYRGTETSITIPDGVVKIGDEVFRNAKVTSVVLSDTVTQIGAGAFENSSLKQIQMTENLKEIGAYAFSYCINLTSVTIPDSVTELGSGAFHFCRNLKNIRLSNSLKCLRTDTFDACEKLNNLTIPESVEYLEKEVFGEYPEYFGKFKYITIPAKGFDAVPFDEKEKNNLFEEREMAKNEGWSYLRYNNVIYVPEIREENYILTLAKEYGIPVVLLALQSEELTLDAGACYELRMNSYAKCDSWSSSDPSVAGVNHYGKITAKKAGTAVITATLYGKEYQCRVTVKDDTAKYYFDYEETEDGNICLKSVSQEYLKKLRKSGSDTFEVPAEIDGKAVTEVGDAALAYLEGFKTLIIPEGIVAIGSKAFASCRELERVVFPSTLRFVGDYAFQKSVLKEIVWPDDISKITFGYMALGDREYGGEEWYDVQEEFTIVGTMLLKVVSEKKVLQIPEGITYIAPGACENSAELEEVIIPEGVTEIGEQAFARCYNLKKVQLPNSIQTVGRWAFSDTPWLQEQELAIHNNILLGVGNKAIVSCVIPDEVIVIADDAFYGCSSLCEITLSERLEQIGQNAFGACSGLTEVTIPASVRVIGTGAFYGCSSLREVDLPEGLEQVGQEAFRNCKALEQIELPDSLNEPGKAMFFGCTSLKNVVLPNKLTYLPDGMFEECTMEEIVLPGTLVTIGKRAFAACGLKCIVIPEGVERIGAEAFEGCNYLSEVQLPDSLMSIGGAAFAETPWLREQEVAIHKNILIAAGNKEIKSYSVPETVTVICDKAFQDCKRLEEITLPDELEYLGDSAFQWCYRLKGSVRIPDGIKQIGAFSFDSCESLTQVVLPTQLESLGMYAFDNCKAIKSMEIPETLWFIGSGALRRCKALESVNLPESLVCIEEGALYGCVKLKEITTVPGSYAQDWVEENKKSFTME